MKRRTLPRKPSKLITIALDDLILVEKSKKYEVDMGEYHTPQLDKKPCLVCFAGAVIAKSLAADSDHSLYPDDFDRKTTKKLYALNDLRQGDLTGAMDQLGYVKKRINKNDYLDRHVTPYKHDSKAFKKEMRKFAKDLAKAGL